MIDDKYVFNEKPIIIDSQIAFKAFQSLHLLSYSQRPFSKLSLK